MDLSTLLAPISNIFSTVWGSFFDSPEVRAVKEKGKIELAQAKVTAKINREAALAKTEGDYDTKAQANMAGTWKDEYLILLHTFPIWGYGIPSVKLHEGLDKIWDKFQSAPYWWWLIYIGIIASTFGLRWLFTKKRLDYALPK